MIGRKSILAYSNTLLGGLLGAFALFFVGRFVPPAAVGMVTFATSTVGILSFLFTIGLDSAHLKFLAERRDLGAHLGTYRVLRLSLTVAAAVLILIATLLAESIVGFHDAATLTVVLMALLVVMVLSFRNIVTDSFRGLSMTANAEASTLVENILRAGGQIMVALAVAAGLGVFGRGGEHAFNLIAGAEGWTNEGIAVAFLASALGAALVALGVALLMHRRAGLPNGKFSAVVAKKYLRFALPIALMAAIWTISTELDAVLIGYFWGAQEVGHYAIAHRVVLLLQGLPLALVGLFLPAVSHLAFLEQHDEAAKLNRQVLRNVSLVLALPVSLLVMHRYDFIHVFIGDRYLPAGNILALLAAFSYILAMSKFFSAIVQGYGHVWTMFIVGGTAAVLNTVLNLVFIPESILGVPLLGLRGTGAALGTVLVHIVVLVMLVAMAPPQYARAIPAVSVLKHISVAIIAAAFPRLLAGAMGVSLGAFVPLAIATAVSGALYLGLLWLCREVSLKDLHDLRGLLNVAEMKSYIRAEVKKK